SMSNGRSFGVNRLPLAVPRRLSLLRSLHTSGIIWWVSGLSQPVMNSRTLVIKASLASGDWGGIGFGRNIDDAAAYRKRGPEALPEYAGVASLAVRAGRCARLARLPISGLPEIGSMIVVRPARPWSGDLHAVPARSHQGFDSA